jgi:hypothetical protein
MQRKQILTIVATVTVFAWSVVMVAVGQAAAIAALAPALGLTVQQVVRTARPQSAAASGHRVEAVPDKEDGAP